MLIHEIEQQRAEAIETELRDVRQLDGRFDLQEWTPGRFQIVPARSGFHALTGLDREHGRVTLLRNTERCVLMVGATAKPFV